MICVVTAYDQAWSELGCLTDFNKRDYCARHGYSFLGGLMPKDWRHAAWLKIRALQDAMAAIGVKPKSDDWLFWSDPDSVIVNPSVRLTDYLACVDETVNFLISDDTKGLNSGNFLIRCTPEMEQFLREVAGWSEMGYNRVMVNLSPWEQRAIQQFFDEGRIPGAKVIPQHWFNSYDPQYYHHGAYKEGDMMLHYPGYDLPFKLARIKERMRL